MLRTKRLKSILKPRDNCHASGFGRDWISQKQRPQLKLKLHQLLLILLKRLHIVAFENLLERFAARNSVGLFAFWHENLGFAWRNNLEWSLHNNLG